MNRKYEEVVARKPNGHNTGNYQNRQYVQKNQPSKDQRSGNKSDRKATKHHTIAHQASCEEKSKSPKKGQNSMKKKGKGERESIDCKELSQEEVSTLKAHVR